MANDKEKFVVSRDEFLRPYRLRAAMNEMISENLKKEGKSEAEINDLLETLDDE